jgi:transcriptional regulator with XRE-family HTH domain
MRVRRVQEIEVLDLEKRLLAARKSSDLSLLEICRQLEITPTYWYKLEKGGADTINYDLLIKIQKLLSLDLDIDFPEDPKSNLNCKEYGMNLSRLKWVKVVTPPKDWKHDWALSPPEIAEHPSGVAIHRHGLTVAPLGFKHEGSEILKSGDLMALTQYAKITHIVEIIDEKPYEEGGWFNRYVKIVWWKPEMDWNELPHREDVLGFDIPIQKGVPYEFTSFEAFRERWSNKGGLTAFQEYVGKQLTLISELEKTLA